MFLLTVRPEGNCVVGAACPQSRQDVTGRETPAQANRMNGRRIPAN
jgi:hypothetical protein